MSHLPCYISSALLVLLLAIQTIQSHRIQATLLERILESKGLEPMSKDNPVSNLIEKLNEERTIHNPPPKTKADRIRFTIPGMPPGFKGKT
jgi:hypothetical protein